MSSVECPNRSLVITAPVLNSAYRLLKVCLRLWNVKLCIPMAKVFAILLTNAFVMSLVCITFKRRTCEHGFVSTISSLMAAVKIWLAILRATNVINICQKMFCLFCRQGKAVGWSYSHVLACLAIWQGRQGKKENVDCVEAGTCFAADVCCIRS